MILGISAPFSPLILIISIGIIYISIFKLGARLHYIPYVLLMLFFVLYLYIGQISLLFDNSYLHTKTDLTDLYRKYISTTIIITAYFTGYQAILIRDPSFNIIKHIAPFLIFTTSFIIITPLIGLQQAMDFSNKRLEGERNMGLFGNPNEAGAFANYTLALLLALVIVSKRKLLLTIAAFGAIYITLTTFSKAAFFVMVLILLYFIYFTLFDFKKNNFKTKAISTFIVVSIIFSSVYVVNHLESIFKNLTHAQITRISLVMDLTSGKITEGTTSERDVLWGYALDIIPNRLLMGHGIGSFHRFNSGPKRLGVHNTYLMILGESGILPFVLFLAFLMILVLKYNVKISEYRFFLIAFMLTFCLNELMTSHNTLGLRYNNALLGIILCYTLFYKNHKKVFNNNYRFIPK